jgi:hypothetical protein
MRPDGTSSLELHDPALAGRVRGCIGEWRKFYSGEKSLHLVQGYGTIHIIAPRGFAAREYSGMEAGCGDYPAVASIKNRAMPEFFPA